MAGGDWPMQSVRRAILRLALAACCLVLLAAPSLAQKRRDLVVFDFVSKWDKGVRGKEVAQMFRGHGHRRGDFTLPDPISFQEALEASHAKVNMESAAAYVSKLASDFFGSQVAIWGEVFKISADDYRLRVRAVDLQKDPDAFALDKTYRSTKHGLQESVEKALDELTGKPQAEEEDIFADQSCRGRKNLCVNGDFERGAESPEAWERVDGLCTFYVKNPTHPGKCVLIDTNVLESQYTPWLKKVKAGAPASRAPKRLPTKPPYYDTVGGTVGAHLYSDPIPIKQGPAYRLDLEYMPMGGEVKCFIKGYAAFGDPKDPDMREVFRAQMNLDDDSACLDPATAKSKWHHYAMVFHPTQPLHVMLVKSDFDDGRTGAKLRKRLVERLNAAGVIEMKDADWVLDRLKGQEHHIRIDASEREVFFAVRDRLGRGVVVWAEIFEHGKKLRIAVRGMDVRVSGTSGSVTKVWRKAWETSRGNLPKVAQEMADVVLEKARVVTHLRVKLDAYWPVNKYYFDNVWLTEETGN